FALAGRVEAEAVGQAGPVLGVEPGMRRAPEMTAELGGDLEDDELVGPGGEAALAAEAGQLAPDGDQGGGGRLVGEVVERGAVDARARAAAAQLAAGRTEQQPVQALVRRLAGRPLQLAQPLRGLLIPWGEVEHYAHGLATPERVTRRRPAAGPRRVV